MSLAPLVYLLCLLAALTCAILLLRSYRRSHAKLLLWTGLGFSALTVNNMLLVLDMIVWPGVSLWVPRQLAAAAAVGIFLYGFMWEAER